MASRPHEVVHLLTRDSPQPPHQPLTTMHVVSRNAEPRAQHDADVEAPSARLLANFTWRKVIHRHPCSSVHALPASGAASCAVASRRVNAASASSATPRITARNNAGASHGMVAIGRPVDPLRRCAPARPTRRVRASWKMKRREMSYLRGLCASAHHC